MEIGLALLVTGLLVSLHESFRQHAGGLWRDELNTVHLATRPAFADTWAGLQFDSFPILIFGVVRAWAAAFGTGDVALRAYGMLIGLGVFGALWVSARLLGHRVPLLAVVLLGCNPLFVRYSDSLRAYGLGILLMLLTFGAVWRVVDSPRWPRLLLAMALGVLSVQCLYYNSVLLFVLCAAGAITAAAERAWRTAAAVLAVGLPAALSLLPYRATITGLHEWNFLVQYPVTVPWLWKRLSEVLGSPDPIGVWLWSVLFLGSLGLAGWRLLHGWHHPAARASGANRRLVFAASTLVLGTICYGCFLKALNYFTQPWYYVTYVALIAVALDVVYAAAIRPGETLWRAVRLAFVWGLAALTYSQARADLLVRQTNLDVIARRLATAAVPGDLIVNLRWECAIPFAQYYKGPVQAVTLPPLADHSVHRYDLVLRQMATPDAARPVLRQMEETLRAGHRVWVIGEIDPPPPGTAPPAPAPAWKDARGWHGGAGFYGVWATQAAFVLVEHANTVTEVVARTPQAVLGYEDLPLWMFAGWH